MRLHRYGSASAMVPWISISSSSFMPAEYIPRKSDGLLVLLGPLAGGPQRELDQVGLRVVLHCGC